MEHERLTFSVHDCGRFRRPAIAAPGGRPRQGPEDHRRGDGRGPADDRSDRHHRPLLEAAAMTTGSRREPLMRPGRRRAILGALTATLVSTVAVLRVGDRRLGAHDRSAGDRSQSAERRSLARPGSRQHAGNDGHRPERGCHHAGAQRRERRRREAKRRRWRRRRRRSPRERARLLGQRTGRRHHERRIRHDPTGAGNGSHPVHRRERVLDPGGDDLDARRAPARHDQTPSAAHRRPAAVAPPRGHARAQIVAVPTTPSTTTLSTGGTGSPATAQPTRDASRDHIALLRQPAGSDRRTPAAAAPGPRLEQADHPAAAAAGPRPRGPRAHELAPGQASRGRSACRCSTTSTRCRRRSCPRCPRSSRRWGCRWPTARPTGSPPAATSTTCSSWSPGGSR